MKTFIISTIVLTAIATPAALSAASATSGARLECRRAASAAYRVEASSCNEFADVGERKACVQEAREAFKLEKLACPAREQ